MCVRLIDVVNYYYYSIISYDPDFGAFSRECSRVRYGYCDEVLFEALCVRAFHSCSCLVMAILAMNSERD